MSTNMQHNDLICPNCGRVGYLTVVGAAEGDLLCRWCGDVDEEADVEKGRRADTADTADTAEDGGIPVS